MLLRTSLYPAGGQRPGAHTPNAFDHLTRSRATVGKGRAWELW
ncbi:hypothetical protein [Mucilaginibacter myungsuensis]|nr:hypothetical protein [Mucilaginibacter myungsuensis]MDN3598417.1 hypothetical protein [Mucilaginibacter myungsuensis]